MSAPVEVATAIWMVVLGRSSSSAARTAATATGPLTTATRPAPTRATTALELAATSERHEKPQRSLSQVSEMSRPRGQPCWTNTQMPASAPLPPQAITIQIRDIESRTWMAQSAAIIRTSHSTSITIARDGFAWANAMNRPTSCTASSGIRAPTTRSEDPSPESPSCSRPPAARQITPAPTASIRALPSTARGRESASSGCTITVHDTSDRTRLPCTNTKTSSTRANRPKSAGSSTWAAQMKTSRLEMLKMRLSTVTGTHPAPGTRGIAHRRAATCPGSAMR